MSWRPAVIATIARVVALSQALCAARDRLAAKCSAAEICDYVMGAAAGGRGPVAVGGWQDDRTVFVFAVESDA